MKDHFFEQNTRTNAIPNVKKNWHNFWHKFEFKFHVLFSLFEKRYVFDFSTNHDTYLKHTFSQLCTCPLMKDWLWIDYLNNHSKERMLFRWYFVYCHDICMDWISSSKRNTKYNKRTKLSERKCVCSVNNVVSVSKFCS